VVQRLTVTWLSVYPDSENIVNIEELLILNSVILEIEVVLQLGERFRTLAF
jgi:hypothetical protein